MQTADWISVRHYTACCMPPVLSGDRASVQTRSILDCAYGAWLGTDGTQLLN